MTMTFTDAESDMDVVPDLEDVEFPCRVCSKEAGPYSGRGPKPKLCVDHKSATSKRSAPRVTGKDANLAAQATAVLVQLNGMMAMGIAAIGMFRTGMAMSAASEGFETAAYAALSTDPEFCKMILKGGAKSAKVSLGLAYGSMAMAIAPTAVEEFKERKAERDAKREEAEYGNGG